MPHPNSLLYNVFIFPWYPMKAFWFVRKSATMITLNDFPEVPKGHKDEIINRAYCKWPKLH